MDINKAFSAIDISGIGLSAERIRMKVNAQNMANANTQRTPEGRPYQRKQVIFETALKELVSFEGLNGTGVKVAGIETSKMPFKKVFDPGNPDADQNGFVRLPNVNVVTEMADMISASRSYEANLAVIKAAKSMFMNSLSILKR